MSVWPTGLGTPRSPAQHPICHGPGVTGAVKSRRTGREHLRGAASPAGWHRSGPSVLGAARHSPAVLEHRSHRCATAGLSQWAIRGQTQREAGKGWRPRDQRSPGRRAGPRRAPGAVGFAGTAPGPSPAFSAGGSAGSRAEGVRDREQTRLATPPGGPCWSPWSALFAAPPQDRRVCPLAPRTLGLASLTFCNCSSHRGFQAASDPPGAPGERCPKTLDAAFLRASQRSGPGERRPAGPRRDPEASVRWTARWGTAAGLVCGLRPTGLTAPHSSGSGRRPCQAWP